ncbi:hypothetical protein M758_2G226900 [Ceratodon purpureus]|nr:hypothetical protein M758_2G226900 [Ceratodon purpureus]
MNCDFPFSLWSPTSPRKPVQYECNNTSSGRIYDGSSRALETPYPQDNPPRYTCEHSSKTKNHLFNKTTTNSEQNEPCCQHVQQGIHKVINKPSRRRCLKEATQKVQHQAVIPVKSLIQNSGPEKALVNTIYGKICNDCRKFEADKAKPIEKLIAETRMNAKLCAECKCHAENKEANYLKPKGKVKSKENKLSPPPPDYCCTEDCVGKRVYNKVPTPIKKSKAPSAAHLMNWPWYWSRYYPTAASRVAKQIIQAKEDAKKVKPQEFEVCFLPLKRCPLSEVSQ